MYYLKYFLIAITVALSGCTNLQTLQDLQVDLIKIEPDNLQSISPRFNIHLLITNPNSEELVIEGMSFQLEIDNQQILSGVANDIPVLKGYSETEVKVSSRVHLLDLIQMMAFLNNKNADSIKYELETTIDPKGFVAFQLHHEGTLNDLLQVNK
ncbi:LEA type 2 family protein [Psychromonas sp. MME2]|uniref:LEA type 2 family protein n=1 Tax=unclassified Psychromonas TaxID=2614957 RepID=UPI00339CDFE3